MKKLNIFTFLMVATNFFCLTDMHTHSLYLDLIKKCVLNLIYEDPGYHAPFNASHREEGRDWPTKAHTMIGLDGLNNIQFCLEDIIKNNVPGDCIETGVWRGGAVILMRAILKEHKITDRSVWVADSFEGLPVPDVQKYPADLGDYNLNVVNKVLGISLETVASNFAKYGLLDNQVKFLKGWFKDTLPNAPIEKLALLRLDGDFYESTMDALVNLYPKLSIGGYIIIDDYVAMVACAQAINDYRKANNITDEMKTAGWSIVYWQKTK